VILEGWVTPPSGSAEHRRIEIPASPIPASANPIWADRVVARIDDRVAAEMGQGKFVGKLGVIQEEPGTAPIMVWSGDEASHQPPLRLSFFQPSMLSLSDQIVDWLSHDRMLAWLGIQTRPVNGGLEITSVNSSSSFGTGPSLAVQGGFKTGDIIIQAGGTPIRDKNDLTVAFRSVPENENITLAYKRGGRELLAQIPTLHKPWIIPTSIIYLAVMLIFGLIVLTVAMVIAGVLTWAERRVAGRMQSRVGPNRVGPQGILQWLADGIKLLLKEDIIPDAVDRPLFKLAPYLVFMGLLGTFVVIPFGQTLIVSDLNIGLLYLMAITGFVALGLMMAGWSSNNKWSLFGGMRSAAQIISYEIPTGLALLVPVTLAGTLSTQALVENQGGWFWQWHIFDNPLIFACFFIYFISALAEGNRTPFDLPEAESELVAGYNVEYSGWRFAVFFLSEWANLFVVGAIATTVFLGGWQVPTPFDQMLGRISPWLLQLAGLTIFFVKSMTLVFVIIWIRWTLPRFRVDQMMNLCWKYFVPWTLGAIVFQALWTWLAPTGLRLAMQWITFLSLGVGLMVLFFSRVWKSWRENPEKFDWNPFY
jgi:NADH-quinone oxidoreductase subunit H